MIVKCATCGKEFNKQKYQVKRSKRHFCSKVCQSEGYKKTDEEKNDANKKYQKRYRSRPDVKEQIKEYQKDYAKKHRDIINKNSREWYRKNKKEQQIKQRQYYKDNIDVMRKKSSDRQKKWKEENPDAYFLSRLRYKLNPLTRFKNRVKQSTEQAKKYGCFVGDKEQLLKKYIEILSSKKISCYYCNNICGSMVAGYNRDVTLDHKNPLSRCGDHDISNLVPCCRGCNSLKGDKTEDEFMEYLKKIEDFRDKL